MIDLDALRIAVLFVGWPGMVLVSAFVLGSATRFYQRVQGSAVGHLVLLMVIGWTTSMGVLAFVATLYLQEDPGGAGAVAGAFLVFWAGSMALMVWLVHSWGAEAVNINLYYAELASMDHIKTQLINTVAHELNTPLTPVLLKFELLRNGFAGPLSPKQSEVIVAIERNLNRLQILVGQVVLATRVQAGRLHVAATATPIRPWLAEMAAPFQVQAKDEHRSFELHCEGDIVAELDRSLMDRVLASVLDNALRYSDPGDAVDVAAQLQGEQLVLIIHDAGRGLTSEEHQVLFQPFRHGQDAKSEKRYGAGLSLYLAKAMIGAHGGTISASSPGPGLGSTFTIVLPLKQTAADGSPRVSAHALQKPKVERH